MGPYLKGVHRYLGIRPNLLVVPTALWGSEAVMPVGDERIHPGPVAVRFGPALRAADLGGTRPLLDHAAAATAALLPEPYRPLPLAADASPTQEDKPDPERAKRVDSPRREG
jgi:1-acyl-sn-glycerol-3-phosphate acyltransferase